MGGTIAAGLGTEAELHIISLAAQIAASGSFNIVCPIVGISMQYGTPRGGMGVETGVAVFVGALAIEDSHYDIAVTIPFK